MKKQILTITLVATFLKVLFIPQVASAQNARIQGTYYGGGGDDFGTGVATDAFGNVYMAGVTNSPNNIGSGGFQDTLGGQYDAFLVKFDPSGNRLWATYYGDEGNEYGGNGTTGSMVATDVAGNVYLAGSTDGYSFNLASGGFQNNRGGGYDGFLVKFDANGNRLWATYYGGLSDEEVTSVATDPAGNVYLAGSTVSSNGIASGGFEDTLSSGTVGAFLVKFNTNGNRLWATYYAGTSQEYGYGIATDTAGNVYLTGAAFDTIGIASGGFQNTFGGGQEDAFLVKFDANGNRLWATYYGGAGNEQGKHVATDIAGNVFMAGFTGSTDSIAFQGFQNNYANGNNPFWGSDAFLVKFDANGNRLWATYYGASGIDEAESIATDATGNVFMAGSTFSTDSIASGGFLNTYTAEDNMCFLVKFDANGNRQCATYYYLHQTHFKTILDGTAGCIALDNAGDVYLAAYTNLDTGVVTLNGFQNTFNGGIYDAYLVKFCPCSNCNTIPPVANFKSSDSTFCTSECINYTDLSTYATSWQWSFPGGTPSSSTTQNPQGICYNTPGTFNATLIASNGGGTDTITFINHIKVHIAPPTPVITQHQDTLFCTTDPSYTSYQWYDSTTLIPGATDTFLVITHGGNYNVAVSNENGCKISVGITIAHNVGINEFSTNNYISLYPNPASTQLTIHILSSRISRSAIISIMNLLGQEVSPPASIQWKGQDSTIDISKLSTGMYFLEMKTESGIVVKRFVKE